ncbi:MAG: O-antigen ligase family protein [Patescibacteria group bacterium]|nr:O-antigen ligase family protein [Patescibacteria group bacterium]
MKDTINASVTRSRVSIFCTHAIEMLWLFLLVALPLFYYRSHQSFNMPKIQLMCITVAFMIAIWIIKSIEGRRFTVRGGAMLWLMTAYFGVMALSTIFSFYPAASWWGTYIRFEGMITYLFYFSAFYLIFWHLRTLTQAYRFFMVAALASLPVSIYGFFQYYGYDFLKFTEDASGFSEIISTLGNSLYLSDYLIMVLPLAFALALIAKRWYCRAAWLALVFTDIYALVLTGKRSGFVALVVMAAIGGFLLLWRWRRSIAIAVGAVGLAAVLMLAFNFNTLSQSGLVQNTPYLRRVASIFNFEDITIKERLAVWQLAVGFIMDRPIIGHGVETFGYVFNAQYPPSFTAMPETIFDRAHNLFLDTAFNVGLVGFVIYLAIFGLAIFQSLKIFFREKNQWFSYLSWGICVALIGFVAHNQFMFENAATRYFLFSYFAVAAAIPLAIQRERKIAAVPAEPIRPTEKIKFWASPEYKIIYYAILIAALAYSVKFHIFPISGDFFYNRALSFGSLADKNMREVELEKAMYYIPDYRSAVYYQRMGADCFIYAQNIKDETRDVSFEKSINWYNEAAEKDPWRYQIFQEEAQVFMIWSKFTTDEAVAQERRDQANILFEKSVSLSPGRQSIYWDWGRALINIKLWDKGIIKYQHAIDMDPLIGRSYFELGKAYRDTSEPEKAREAFDKAIELGYTGDESDPL